MSFHRYLLTAALASSVVLGGLSASARDLPVTKAERVGMSSERLDRLTALGAQYTSDGRVPGIVTLVAREGRVVHFEASGVRGLGDNTALAKDDLFRIYSMTKPITSAALMMLYEEGRFHLKDPIGKYIPELAQLSVYNPDGEPTPAQQPVTMGQILTHTAGFSYGFNPKGDPVDALYVQAKIFEAKDLDDFAKRVAKLPLKFEPALSGTTASPRTLLAWR